MNLSAHFTLAEMVVSQTASRKGIDNTPGPNEIAALKQLCEKVLEAVRVHFDRPVIVTSGFRSVTLNKKIGGSSTSQHCQGEAADFTIPGVSNYELCKWMERNLDYDQLIYEYGESGWVHVSYQVPFRNMELTKRRGTRYIPGIVR
jgi:zinc D-Ala-D-Ala carboxypeptidase